MSPSEFLSLIEGDRDKTEEAYKIQHALFQQHYNFEQELAAEYHGRQIVELMQNADDAGADKLWIELNTDEQLLIVANNGVPFNREGIEAIRLGGVSSKPKTKFIGNKGLGFRSVLKWSTSLTLNTHGCRICFSEELAKQKFKTLVSVSDQEKIRQSAGLAETVIPFPLLSLPGMELMNEEKDKKTVLEIRYIREMQDSIEKQLASIGPELLLFLKNLETIYVKIDAKLDHKLHLEKTTRDPFRDDNAVQQYLAQDESKIWNVVYTEKILPADLQDQKKKEQEKYSIGIAWQDNLNDRLFKLFSFFPTKEQLHLPCIVHATFDLSSNRNGLNESPKNEFILDEVVKLLEKVAEKIKMEATDWRAYQVLSPVGTNGNPTFNEFFEKLQKVRNVSTIYPAVNGNYHNPNSIKFYGNDFSEWVIRNHLREYFPGLLLPLPEEITLSLFSQKNNYEIDEFTLLFDTVSQRIATVEERVKLIRILLADSFKKHHQRHLPLILTEGSNFPAAAITEVFTLKQGSIDEYQVPTYARIAFIDSKFYELLEREFDSEITANKIANEHASRSLKRILSPIVNLGSNDIINVIQNLTRSFNTLANKERKDYRGYVSCLFRIFRKNPERKGTLSEPIYLLNRNGNIRKADELFLGKEFKSGIITEKIYEGYYSNEDYVSGNDVWELPLEGFDEDVLEDFFIWLGVNRYVKFKKLGQELQGRHSDDEYSHFVFSNIGWPELISYREYKVAAFEHFEEYLKSPQFRIEKLIALIIKEKNLYKKLDDENNDDDFYHYYNGNTRKPSSKPSYFKYQLNKSHIFEDVFVDIEFVEALGLKTVNVKDSLFLELEIKDTEVWDVMHKVAVKTSIHDLPVEKVYRLLDATPKDYTASRKLYQQAFDYFRQLGGDNLAGVAKQSRLLAINGKTKEYRPTDEIYYSDNVTLPSKIVEQFWIFDFPKRSGEKQVAEFFGVKTFKDISIKVADGFQPHPESERFENWLNKIKPFLLAYRLNGLKNETSEKAVVILLKSISIQLVTSLYYSIDGGPVTELYPNEFINTSRQDFFICGDLSSSLDELKETPAFCEAFAEVLCVLFEVNENKDEFRSIFKDKIHLKDTLYLIETRSLQSKLDEAKMLLGLSKFQLDFWKAVAGILNIEWDEEISNEEELQKTIASKLPFNFTNTSKVNYERFENEESFQFLRKLSDAGITLKKLKEKYIKFPALKYWHIQKLNQASLDIEEIWNKAWWYYFSGKDHTEQRQFNLKRKEYNNAIFKAIEMLAKENCFVISLIHKEVLLQVLAAWYQLEIIEDNLKNITIENLYADLLTQYKVNLPQLPDDIQSLLFFPGKEVYLTEAFEGLKLEEPEGNDSEEIDTGFGQVKIITASAKKGNLGSFHLKPGKKNNKGGTHLDKTDKYKKRAGKKAEKLVRDQLRKYYPNGEVIWISGNSDDNKVPLDDSKGYDIRYKRHIDDVEWIYLEVKSFSGGSFIISLNEVDIGIQNKNHYQIALVEGMDIYLVDGFFQNDERVEEFINLCSNTSIKPLNFEVFIDLSVDNIETEASNPQTYLQDVES